MCVIAGLYYFKPVLLESLDSKVGFDAFGNPHVLLFTSNNCGRWCTKAAQELKTRKVFFQELSTDTNEENKRLFEKSGGSAFPHLVAGSGAMKGYDKAQMASILAQSFGDQYLTRVEKYYFKNHFYEDDSPKVYMYGASWCGYCRKMREYFKDKNIDYVELDVEKAENKDELIDVMRIRGYPVLYVGYQRINGANIRRVLKAIKTAKHRTT